VCPRKQMAGVRSRPKAVTRAPVRLRALMVRCFLTRLDEQGYRSGKESPFGRLDGQA
jgi:hypothetical protein